MAREIAHGEVVIGVDLERVGAELAHAEAQFSRSLANIDRMKASAEADLDIGPLKRDIAEAKALLKTLEAEAINPDIELDKEKRKALQEDIRRVKAELKGLEAQKIKIDVDARELADLNRQTKIAEQRAAALEKSWIRNRKEAEAMQKMWQNGAALQQRGIDMDRKRSIEIEKLRVQYIKLHDEIEKGHKLALFDFLGDEAARRKFAQTRAELDALGSRLKELGDTDDDLRSLARASDDTNQRLRKTLSSLGSVRLQMGFFSATLRQTATAFTALGPILFAVGGQLASLVGVLGTGLAGALAVSGAGLGGFALSALGIGLIMKPLVGDLQDAMKASNAYGDAVRKYGRNSTQAQTAQEKLNKTLGDVGPETRKAFESLGGLSDRWGRLTSSARPMFFETMAAGIQSATKILPTFARQSVSAFSTAGRETQKWFEMFSSPEAVSGIRELMSNFTSAVPDLSAGLRSIFAGLSRIATSASKLLPSLTSGFKEWASGLEDSIGTGASLDARIARLVDHMRQVGQFAQSAGSMLATFFSAGANEGASLLSTLTSIFDRWNAWMQTASGQRGLADFFSQANDIGSQFFSTLGQIGVALFEFSAAFAPLSQGALAVVHAIATVTAALISLGPAQQVVTTLGGALAGAFVVGKIYAAVAAVGALRASLMALQLTGVAGSLVSLMNPITAIGVGIGAAVAFFATLETKAAAASNSLDDLSGALASTQAMIDGLASADSEAAAAKLAVLSAQMQVTKATEAYNSAANEYGRQSRQAREADLYRKQAILSLQDAQRGLTTETKQQFQAQNKVVRQAHDDLQKINEVVKQAKEQADRGPFEKIADGLGGLTDLQKLKPGRFLDSMRDLKEMVDGGASASEVYARALELQAKATRQVDKATAAASLSQLNAARNTNKQLPINQKLAASWERIGDVIPRGGTRLFKLADPKETSQLIQMTDKLRSLGRGQQAGQILLNTKNIDEALAKMRQLTKRSTTLVEAKVNTGRANQEIKQLGKGKTATINTKADTKGAERSLKGLSGKQIAARLTIRANNSDAMSKLNQVERRQLRAKLVRLGASDKAANAAIAAINGKKLEDKVAKFKAETGEAESGNRKVQGFRDKTVQVKTTADLSGASAAQSAINAIPNTTYKDVITRYSSQGNPGRAAGGPTAGAYAPMPAQDRRNAGTAAQANYRQSRPGRYSRPTLLVGEERQDEWVIASNPSYRGANEMYLREAASEFGFALTPFDEMAYSGKKPKDKKPKDKKRPALNKKVGKFGRSRTGYDYIRSEINRLTEQSSNRSTARQSDIDAGRTPSYSLDAVIKPLEDALDPWYNRLQDNLTKRANKAANRAVGAKESMSNVNDELKAARKNLATKRKLRPPRLDADASADEKKRARATERNQAQQLRAAEKRFEEAQKRKQQTKDSIRDGGDTAGALWRELRNLPNEREALQNQIQALRDNKDSEDTEDTAEDPIGIQLGKLDAARYDVWQQYAGNILPGVGMAAPGALPGGPLGPGSSPAMPAVPAAPSFYSTPAGGVTMPGGSSSGRAAGTGSAGSGSSGGTTVQQTINISEPPPDPHSFSKQLGWEAAAMLG